MILAAWRAIPVMAIIAIVAAGLLWFSGTRQPPASGPRSKENPPETFQVGDVGMLGPVTSGVSTCAISAREECVVSTEDVLATMINQGREDKREVRP